MTLTEEELEEIRAMFKEKIDEVMHMAARAGVAMYVYIQPDDEHYINLRIVRKENADGSEGELLSENARTKISALHEIGSEQMVPVPVHVAKAAMAAQKLGDLICSLDTEQDELEKMALSFDPSKTPKC